jgi:hypothetical protein
MSMVTWRDDEQHTARSHDGGGDYAMEEGSRQRVFTCFAVALSVDYDYHACYQAATRKSLVFRAGRDDA